MSEATIYYLEMNSPQDLRGKSDAKGLDVRECEVKQYEFNRFLYQFVGKDWDWTDKLSWTAEQWQTYAEADNLRTWVAYWQGSPAGYYELQRQEQGDVEICYFGLVSRFIGHGFGGYLLTHTLRSAWAWEGTRRVWLHTCSLDHPAALANYKARGMQLYRVEEPGSS